MWYLMADFDPPFLDFSPKTIWQNPHVARWSRGSSKRVLLWIKCLALETIVAQQHRKIIPSNSLSPQNSSCGIFVSSLELTTSDYSFIGHHSRCYRRCANSSKVVHEVFGTRPSWDFPQKTWGNVSVGEKVWMGSSDSRSRPPTSCALHWFYELLNWKQN